MARLAHLSIPAASLYTGQQHRLVMRGMGALRSAVRREPVRLSILSAGFGLVDEDTLLPPYESTFSDMGRAEVSAWARELGIPGAVRKTMEAADVVLVLLGAEYLRAIEPPVQAHEGQRIVYLVSPKEVESVRAARVTVVPAGEPQRMDLGTTMISLKGRMFELFALGALKLPGLLEELVRDDTPGTFLRAMEEGRAAALAAPPPPSGRLKKVRRSPGTRGLTAITAAAVSEQALPLPVETALTGQGHVRSGPERLHALNRLYGLLAELRDRLGGYRYLRDCSAASGWPRLGLYFFFEEGEVRADGSAPRVVRVGTHALKATSRATLWKRLGQHRGGRWREGTPGCGNHRGSVFRQHAGSALAKRLAVDAEVVQGWGGPKAASREVRLTERPLEEAVSSTIGAMGCLWLEVADPPGPASHRGYLERNCIGLLSNFEREALDSPSPSWLGLLADSPYVRASGLWNVNHVQEGYEPGFLDVLEGYVRGTRRFDA